MKELINRYVWIVDVLNRYGRLTREDINDLWRKSPLSNGDPMPARTFYHYRRAIEENFQLEIACDASGHYYIDETESNANPMVTNWLLESYSVNNAIKGSSIPHDRVSQMSVVNEEFEMPQLKPETFFENLIGITASKADVRTVKIMTTPIQAKYFRALPFHHTQQEELHDRYSIFTYRLKLNYELVHEILSYGDALKVLAPRELQLMVQTQLENTLKMYENPDLIPRQ